MITLNCSELAVSVFFVLNVCPPKESIFLTTFVVYFDQLSGAVRTQKLVETLVQLVHRPTL